MLFAVVAVAFLVPLLLGAFPGLQVSPVALEITAGVLIGPSVLDWVGADVAVEVLSLLGLAFLLFLAGMELDLGRLGGRTLGLAGGTFCSRSSWPYSPASRWGRRV